MLVFEPGSVGMVGADGSNLYKLMLSIVVFSESISMHYLLYNSRSNMDQSFSMHNLLYNSRSNMA